MYLLRLLILEVVRLEVSRGILIPHLVLVTFPEKDVIDLLQDTTNGDIFGHLLGGGIASRLDYWRTLYLIDGLNVFEVQIWKSLEVDVPLLQGLNEVTADQFRLLHLDTAIQFVG